MAKLKLILVSIICITLIISTILYLFMGINILQLPKYLITQVKVQRQISIQIQEAKARQKDSPSEDEINQMKSNSKLCFTNDDCRSNPSKLYDCNESPSNKYYTGIRTPQTLIGCAATYYSTCDNNVCIRHSVTK